MLQSPPLLSHILLGRTREYINILYIGYEPTTNFTLNNRYIALMLQRLMKHISFSSKVL